MPVSGLSIARCAPLGPSIAGSKNIGVKKMPNMSTTCTMYFTSRKKRLAQLRKSETPVVKSTSNSSEQWHPREARVKAHAEERQDDDEGDRPIEVSNDWRATEESGSTSRGK